MLIIWGCLELWPKKDTFRRLSFIEVFNPLSRMMKSCRDDVLSQPSAKFPPDSILDPPPPLWAVTPEPPLSPLHLSHNAPRKFSVRLSFFLAFFETTTTRRVEMVEPRRWTSSSSSSAVRCGADVMWGSGASLKKSSPLMWDTDSSAGPALLHLLPLLLTVCSSDLHRIHGSSFYSSLFSNWAEPVPPEPSQILALGTER